MTTSTADWTEQRVHLAETDVQLLKGGSGKPLLLLHGEMGHPGWLRYHRELAKDRTLYMPSHPGFGSSPRLDWIVNMRDMAGWYLQALDDMGIGPVDTIGLSLGGWLAAEMATMSPQAFRRLVLVSPPGVRPPAGEIYDMFLVTARDFMIDSVLDPEGTPEFGDYCPERPSPELAGQWEVNREQACRLSWRPYMFYPGLPHLLRRLKDLPTLLIWGMEDRIVPVSAAQVYNDSIPGSRLELFDGCGHRPELERTDRFVSLVREFLS